MKYSLIIIGLLYWSSSIEAQSNLSFEKALELTLANNYDIQMARVSEEIAENNASWGNNGFLPTVSATGAYNWTYYEGENRLITETRTFDANNSYNYNGLASVSYTLFDGQGRRYTYLQSKANLELSQLQLKQVIQTTILELGRLYYELARLEESVVSLNSAVEISQERFERARYLYDYGQAKQLDVLNARVDLNTDSINLVTGIQELENLRRSINYIMGQEIGQEVLVEHDLSLRENINREEALASAQERNLQLQLAERDLSVNEYAIGAARASWLPTLGANAGYQYRGTEDPNGAFVIASNSYGPQAGLSLSWTIFNGKNSTQLQNAKLSFESKKIEKKSLEQSVYSEVLNAHASYQNLLFVYRAQRDNVTTAEDNFQRSEDAYALGQLSSVEFRQAQLNLLQAEQALSKARYDAKNAEFQLLAVMGILVQ